MQNIEDQLFNLIHPVNSYPILERLKELLKENNTNSLNTAIHQDVRVQKCFLLLIIQTVRKIGQLNILNWYIELEMNNIKYLENIYY